MPRFREDVWGALPTQFNGKGLESLVSADAVWQEIDCGLLARPFVRLHPDSRIADITRMVVNNPLSGYMDLERTRNAVQAGAVLVLERAELWHSGVTHACSELARDLPFGVTGTVVLLPLNKDAASLRAVLGASTSEHLLIAVTQGSLYVDVGRVEEANDLPGAFSGIVPSGAVVYVPPLYALQATAADDTTTVVVFRVSEPSANQLAEVALALFVHGPAQNIAGTHQAMTLVDKLDWLRDQLSNYCSSISAKSLLEHYLQVNE
ncbi:MAG: hypothetical protein H0T78_08735 [Longispora sp.]|nr:hypothetical protein [Longispora sp. (in: high G+C Gram-positive bacteria)]